MSDERPLPDRIRRRLSVVVLSGAIVLLLGLFGRLIYINKVESPRLLELAAEQRRATAIVPARRGMIFDSRGRTVAASEQTPDVFLDPVLIRDLPGTAQALAPRLNTSADEIVEKIRSRPGSRFIIVAEAVDEITAEAVSALKLPGVGLSDRFVRKYPLHESMAHVLGWVGRDRKGLEGIELLYDAHLAGKDGRRGTITDARRRALGRTEDDLVLPQDGGHVVLTIDAEIQRMVESALREAIDKVSAESGIGVLMDPYTGDIVAMACWPSFDANEAHAVPVELRRNRAVTDPTEPGSTFKPFIASGALEGSYVNTTEKIHCQDGAHYFGRRLITDTKPRGILDLKGILAKSSNIGMGLIAERMGNPALHATMRRFKFGEKTGVDFPGEDPGVVYSLPKWTRLSTQSVAMGYEVLVTPLQLARAFSAIVNDGVLVQPRLVKQLLSASGEVVKSHDEPRVTGRAVSSQVAAWMLHEAMVAVVQEGGGTKAQGQHYSVLGKTGTAKLMYADKPLYEPGAYLGTFIGAAPATKPELVAVVMVRRPDAKKAYYGGAIAAPAVSTIFDQSLAYLGVPPDRRPAERVAATGQ